MQIKSSKFIKSCADPKAANEFKPQICVAGRSNCGKSTLLNMLMDAKLCKTSQTPGRTRLVNVFEVKTDGAPFFLTDLPGYGFSKADRRESDEFNMRTEAYFTSGNDIAQVLCLMDIRRDPSDLDKVLINYLRDMNLPFTVALTKADKFSRVQCADAALRIAAALGLARDNLIVTSGNSGLGKDKLINRLGEVLAAHAEI